MLHADFDRLELGTEVRFEPEMGGEGPQANTVQLVNKRGGRAGRGEESTCNAPNELRLVDKWFG